MLAILTYNQLGFYYYIISTGFELAEHVRRLVHTLNKQKLWQEGETLVEKKTIAVPSKMKNNREERRNKNTLAKKQRRWWRQRATTTTSPAEIEAKSKWSTDNRHTHRYAWYSNTTPLHASYQRAHHHQLAGGDSANVFENVKRVYFN